MPTVSRVPNIALAYEYLPGASPVVVFCPGYASDMGGTKAMALQETCAATGQAMLRFDYAGHGQSEGRFIDGTIGDWTEDAAHIIATVIPDKNILLCGSSMGGWIALLLALRLPRLAALLLIAPAPDFTELLMKPALDPEQEELLQTEGVIHQPSPYGDPTPITQKLLEEGANHLLLGGPIPITCPVRILHGIADTDVPWDLSLRLIECLESQDVYLNYIKDGDHRLSRAQDIALLRQTLTTLLGEHGA